MTLGICLALALTASAAQTASSKDVVFIAAERFTLAWTHSIEKVRWEEDYAVVSSSQTVSGLSLEAVSARVKGSAAGMEPGPEAVLKEGWYHYVPAQRFHERLQLTRSQYTQDYELCIHGTCRAMSHYLKSDGWMTTLFPCKIVGQ